MSKTVMHLIMFSAAFIVSLSLIPLIIRISLRHSIYDDIDARKIHKGQISRLGGVAVFVAFFALMIFVLSDARVHFNRLIYICAVALAFLTGFLDDLFRIRARYKFILQISAAVLAVISGLSFDAIKVFSYAEINFGMMASVITVIWIVTFMNAVNLIDGMDGLSTGIVIIANVFVYIIAIMSGSPVVAALSAVLGGAVLGFYVFNFPPARIFLGDGGAYFIGFVYATIPLMGIKKSAVFTLFLVPMVLLLVPIADVIQVMINRYKRGTNLFFPDKSHLHHRLMSVGVSTKGILFVMYTYTVVLGLSAIMMISVPPHLSLMLFAIIMLLMVLSFYLLNSAERVIEGYEENTDTVNRKKRNTRAKKRTQ
jgi:UDP-GlcNAc:undecaprenyl-phosphate/decaprenyl-phosphate GlcNAc-1-phosphate transferase